MKKKEGGELEGEGKKGKLVKIGCRSYGPSLSRTVANGLGRWLSWQDHRSAGILG